SDDTVQVVTAWAVLNEHKPELNLFIHLLDQDGTILAQQDNLGAPSWQWGKGDRFLHLHTLVLPSTNLNDVKQVTIGVFHPDDMTRLPLLMQDINIDRILLPVDFTK
ncbi:MAG: hypothetical protein P1S60_18785, partial [Anaerolineae bacterium]|nr:hypothetical protein [Anaerolineae bacterium]